MPDYVDRRAPGVLVSAAHLVFGRDRRLERGLYDSRPVRTHRLGHVHLGPEVDEESGVEVEAQVPLFAVREETLIDELAVGADRQIPPELVVVLVDQVEELDRAEASWGFQPPQPIGGGARNPCSRRTSPGMGKQRPYVATTKQIWALYDSVPAGVRPAILLGAHAGLRLAEAAALRVENVDFATGLVAPTHSSRAAVAAVYRSRG